MRNFLKNTLKTTTASILLASTFSASASGVWEIKKGDDALYIGGTIHVLPVSEFPLPKVYTDTYAKVDEVVLEAKLPNPSDQEKQMYALKAMSYEEGTTLSQFISEDTKTALSSYFEKSGIDYSNLDKFKPSFITTMITAIEIQKAGLNGQGVDVYFSQLATRDNKPLQYLETFEFQVELMANLGVGYENESISLNLEKAPKTGSLVKKLIKAWREGDEAQIEELALTPMKQEFPYAYKSMMTDRNLDWVPKIEKLFGNDSQEFVLVGAGHLVGEQNVIQMLTEKGYTVRKL